MPRSSRASEVSAPESQAGDSQLAGSKKSSSTNWQHQALAQVKQKVLEGHTDAVNTCQFVCNDQKILSASNDRSVILWDFETDEVLQRYEGHSHFVSAARMSPCNTKFVSGGWDKKMHVWDAETGRILWTGDHGGIVSCVNFSHDGKYIVSASDIDFNVKVWDVEGNLVEVVKDLHTSSITSCMFSPNDQRLITTSMDQTTKFWDRKTAVNTITLQGHINIISDCSITWDERRFATASWDKTVQLWDIATGTYRSKGSTALEKCHDGSISCCDFSPDSTMLVSGSYDMGIVVWDVENCIQKLKLQGHDDWVEDVCFSQDQMWLLSASKDKTVRVWNIEESDHIPVVMDNKKAVGIKILTCSSCGKPFSMAQLSDTKTMLCVFCRLNKERQYISIANEESGSDVDVG